LISVEEARAMILAPLRAVGAETVSLAQAWNRVLAQPVVARLTQPPDDVSAMDGYAVRTPDGADGAVLRVIGSAPAGHPFAGVVGPGQAIRLFTGSVVPDAADGVVPQEDVRRDGDLVTLLGPARSGAHIRPRGQDFAEGDTVLQPGTRLGARQIGLAAAANHAWLGVRRRPMVAILATGDEIVLPGESLGPGGIVSSNSHMLAALVRAAGGEALILPVARDTPEAIAAALDAAPPADLMVTTGGVSVGDHDAVQDGLALRGFALDFWKIAMRPGKPMISGRLGALPVLGLPGNPVSAFVCAVLFLLPALARLLGLPAEAPPTQAAVTGAALRENDHRADHLRGRLAQGADGRLVATAFARQDSAMLHVLASADCLVLRAPHAPALAAGGAVEIISLAGLGI
jgi:molybdopterin molybdotransferase